jgi:Ferritin-like
MIEIDKAAVDTVRTASQPSDLHPSLQAALVLEHATIPLYLTALYSLVPGTNRAALGALKRTVLDEMLHFAIVANVLNALGGQPKIDHKETVPSYPGTLPMGVAGGVQVELKRMSIDQCRVFMIVEEPDVPIARRPHPDQTTIGDFYAAMIDKIGELGSDAFQSPSAPQVSSRFFPDLQPITDAGSAVHGLQLIVEQGEGTRSSPFEGTGANRLAHFYRFAEIVHGAKLTANTTALGGFSYTGDPVNFDATAVIPMAKPATLTSLTDPSEATALRLATTFCGCYRRLLTALQQAFNGQPDKIDDAIGLMNELKVAARNMLDTPDPNDPSLRLTPSWEYLADPTPH